MTETQTIGGGLRHVIDGAVPLLTAENYFEHEADIRTGELTALAPTVASLESYGVAMAAAQQWHRLAESASTALRICTNPGDLQAARQSGQTGIILHFQGGDPIEGSLERLREFAEVGVRVMQPTYNDANALGAGSLTDESFGLTPFGRTAVKMMGELGVIPDVSHASERTALDTLETATGAVIASHSNAKALYDHPRNIGDEVIRGVAGRDGVVGVCGFPGFLGPETYSPSADDLIDHAIYIAELVGDQYVSLGLDFADEDEDDYEYFGYDPKVTGQVVGVVR
jgi:membrane dipeptidase